MSRTRHRHYGSQSPLKLLFGRALLVLIASEYLLAMAAVSGET
jgi:hypothetical protein